ncbi:hypothetical protein ACTEIW_002222 [Citrobacter freundii]
MSTITKEQLRERARQKVKSLELAVTQSAFAYSRAELEEELELARIALASLEAEAVADVVAWSSPNEERTCDVHLRRHDIKPGPLYAAPPAQAVPEVYNIGDATMRHIFTPAGITDVSDMQAVFDQIETVLAGMWQPAPVSLTEEQRAMLRDMDDEIVAELDEEERICRAAMLQGAEPVTTAYKLPEGWVAVPVEPTYQMCKAMGLPWESQRFPDRYKAMISAAKNDS